MMLFQSNIQGVTINWFTNSPDTGNKDCICSYCNVVIEEEEGPAIRMWHEIKVPRQPGGKPRKVVLEARFHHACYKSLLAAKVFTLSR